MISEFVKYLEKSCGWQQGEKLLVAVSGGIDSMVLCDLLAKSKIPFELAHCNYHLRGDESNRDESFIREFAQKQSLKVHVKSFDSKQEAALLGMGIQQYCREARYDWFESLRHDRSLNWILTAHHANDQAETILHNMLRGTGPKGMRGILPRSGSVLRPILFALKSQILTYAKEHDLNFVSDSSNDTLDYERNRIRHELIPQLEDYNPSIVETLARQTVLFQESWHLNQIALESLKHFISISEKGNTKLSVAHLKNCGAPHLVIALKCQEEGIPEKLASEVFNLLEAQTGRRVLHEHGAIVRDHEYLVFHGSDYLANDTDENAATFHTLDEWKQSPDFEIDRCQPSEIVFNNSAVEIYLNEKDLRFPLEWRRWEVGDRMLPFGMKREQKVSDILTQKKIGTTQRKEVRVLFMEGRMLWIPGVRTSELTRIDKHNRTCLRVRWNSGN